MATLSLPSRFVEDEITRFMPVQQLAWDQPTVDLFNPYHDEHGRFTSAANATRVWGAERVAKMREEGLRQYAALKAKRAMKAKPGAYVTKPVVTPTPTTPGATPPPVGTRHVGARVSGRIRRTMSRVKAHHEGTAPMASEHVKAAVGELSEHAKNDTAVAEAMQHPPRTWAIEPAEDQRYDVHAKRAARATARANEASRLAGSTGDHISASARHREAAMSQRMAGTFTSGSEKRLHVALANAHNQRAAAHEAAHLRHVGHVNVATARKVPSPLKVAKTDKHGSLQIGMYMSQAVAACVAKARDILLGNPNHDDKGKFASGGGVNVEVAPNPADKAVTGAWDTMAEGDKARVTQEVGPKVLNEVSDSLHLPHPTIEHTLGGFMGGTNPTMVALMPASVPYDKVVRWGHAAGYALRQNSVIGFNESDHTSGQQTSFIKVMPSKPLSYADTSALYKHVYAQVPEAMGFTAYDGALSFGNFPDDSGVKRLSDAAFAAKIKTALATAPVGDHYETTVHQFRSDWIPTESKPTIATIAESPYANSQHAASKTGRDDIRQQGRDIDTIRAHADSLTATVIARHSHTSGRKAG